MANVGGAGYRGAKPSQRFIMRKVQFVIVIMLFCVLLFVPSVEMRVVKTILRCCLKKIDFIWMENHFSFLEFGE